MSKKLSDCGEVLNVEDIQEVLGVGRNTVLGLLRDGEIKSFRAGKKYLVPNRAVKNFIDKCMNNEYLQI